MKISEKRIRLPLSNLDLKTPLRKHEVNNSVCFKTVEAKGKEESSI